MHLVSLFVTHPNDRALPARLALPGDPLPLDLVLAAGDSLLDIGCHAAIAWCVLRGRALVRAREGSFELGPRDWIALERDSAPTAWLGSGSLVLGIGVDSTTQRAMQAAADGPVLFAGRGRMPPGTRGMALRVWRSRVAQAETGKPARQDAHRFLALLQSELGARAGRCPGHSQQRKRQVLLRMQRARLYLEGHAGAGLRVAELAERCNFSPWYFTKIFHSLFGTGPQQFAAQLRLAHACRLLSATRLPVTEISAASGFDNPCSFSRAFRAQHGMTASEYRLLHSQVPPVCDAAQPWNLPASMPWQQARGAR
jgi:AraC family transcriptional regulator